MPDEGDFVGFLVSAARTEGAYPTWLIALTFAFASGLTHPLGALVGILVTPVPVKDEFTFQNLVLREGRRKNLVGGMLAFGAGSLLFAVTVELYGKQMRRLETFGYTRGVVGMSATTCAALLGGWLYHYTDRWFQRYLALRQAANPEEAQESTALLEDAVSPDQSPQTEVKLTGNATVAVSMWLGVFMDGLPEGVLLGTLAAEKQLSMVLVISLFIANFPEAFSAASMLREARWPIWKILGMWWLCCVTTAVLAGIACALFPIMESTAPIWMHVFEASIEGLAGGAMLSCITSVMLPEAYAVHNDTIGLLALSGFLASVAIKVCGGVASELVADTYRAPEEFAGPNAQFIPRLR